VADRSPVITGLGVISALGSGIDEIWPAIVASQSGLKPLTLFQSPRYGQIPVGEITRDLTELGAPLLQLPVHVRGLELQRVAEIWQAARSRQVLETAQRARGLGSDRLIHRDRR